jgi:hypothetical protein
MGHLTILHKGRQDLDQTHAGELIVVEAEDPIPFALLVEPGEDPLYVAGRLYAKDPVCVLVADSLREVVARGVDGHDHFVGEAPPDPQKLVDILGRILRRYTQREIHPRLPTAFRNGEQRRFVTVYQDVREIPSCGKRTLLLPRH